MKNLHEEAVNLNREHSEQPNGIKENECSHHGASSANTAISLVEKVCRPMDILPPKLIAPTIERPCYRSYDDWFTLDGRNMPPGLYFHKAEDDGNDKQPLDARLCSPLTIEGITSSTQGEDFGRVLRFLDSNGQWHEWAMPMYLLKGSGDELIGELLNKGLTFSRKHRTLLLDYLMHEQPTRRIIAATKVGWHGQAFVLHNQTVGNGDIVFQSEISAENDFLKAGTEDGWKSEIGQLCAGNIPLMLSISAALSGPLFNGLNRKQGAGIHWIGDSSSGKSTAAEIAASVWGPPEFIRSWSTTANGLEGMAAAHNDTCLILDEIDEASPYEIGKIVYMLGNGQGKQRANRIGSPRKVQRWRIVVISTGERAIESIMNEVNKTPNSGQQVRLLCIPSTFVHGIFSDLHGFENGRCLADHLKIMRLQHHGHIGPSFIKKLMDDPRNLCNELHNITQVLSSDIKCNLGSRAATVFSIFGLAGELGIDYGLLPWPQGSALEAARTCFKRWLAFHGEQQTEHYRILKSVSDFISKHGSSRFSPYAGNSLPVQNRAGWRRDENERVIYLFTPGGLEEAGKPFPRPRIVKALKEAGWVAEHDHNRHTKKLRVDGTPKDLYCIEEKENKP